MAQGPAAAAVPAPIYTAHFQLNYKGKKLLEPIPPNGTVSLVLSGGEQFSGKLVRTLSLYPPQAAASVATVAPVPTQVPRAPQANLAYAWGVVYGTTFLRDTGLGGALLQGTLTGSRGTLLQIEMGGARGVALDSNGNVYNLMY